MNSSRLYWSSDGTSRTIPQSRMQSFPSRVRRRLPGCGSQCNTPVSRSMHIARRQLVDDGGGRHSIQAPRAHGPGKCSSACRLSPIVQLIDEAPSPLVNKGNERSSETESSTFGRCTLTATLRPSRRTPRYTWPTDAEATGLGESSEKIVPSSVASRRPSSCAMTARPISAEKGGTLSWSWTSPRMYGAGSRSCLMLSACPTLMAVGPSFETMWRSSSERFSTVASSSSRPAHLSRSTCVTNPPVSWVSWKKRVMGNHGR
eukprot:scaffold112077_cov32-Tisochrysis_lutea.AAC.2